MAAVSQDALLEGIGIMSDLQHVDIVVGFQKKDIRVLQAGLRIVRVAAQVCADTGFLAAFVYPVAHRLRRVVGDRHGVDLEITHTDRLIGADTDKPVRINVPVFRHPGQGSDRPPGRVDRHLRIFRDHRQPHDMIRVLMGQKDTVDVLEVQADVMKSLPGPFPADAHIHQQMGPV